MKFGNWSPDQTWWRWLLLNHARSPITIPDVCIRHRTRYYLHVGVSTMFWNSGAFMYSLADCKYVVLLCVGMRDATGRCDPTWTSLCRVGIIFGTSSCTSPTFQISKRILKDIFSLPLARWHSPKECVMLLGGQHYYAGIMSVIVRNMRSKGWKTNIKLHI